MTVGTMDRYARGLFPNSYRQMAKFSSSGQSARTIFLAPLARQSAAYFLDDFLADTINGNLYTAGETGTGTPFAKPATDLASGVVTGVTGATSGNAETLYGYPHYLGDQNCWVEFFVKVDDVTSLAMEAGFLDTATDLTITTVSDVDTPALAGGTSDIAMLHMDTSQTLKTMALVTDGTTANMNTTAITLSPVFSPVNATYHTYTIGVAGDYAFAMVDGRNLTATASGAVGQRIEGGSLLRFFLACRTRTTAARTMDLDYVAAGQDRLTRVA